MERLGIDSTRLKQGAIVMGALVLFLWLVEGVDFLSGHSLDQYGIHPWSLEGLSGIVFSPFLHIGFAHVAANSVPLFVLGTALWTSGIRQFIITTILSWVVSGLFAWLLTPINYVVAGFSGIIFGWTVYLLIRGIISRDWKHLVVGVIVLVLYGSALLSILPTAVTVSWQAHLGGAIGGALAAYLMHRRAAAKTKAKPVI